MRDQGSYRVASIQVLTRHICTKGPFIRQISIINYQPRIRPDTALLQHDFRFHTNAAEREYKALFRGRVPTSLLLTSDSLPQKSKTSRPTTNLLSHSQRIHDSRMTP